MSARAVDTLHHATATSTRPCVQAHNNTLRRTAATATRPCAQAHTNKSRRTAAMATRPRAQAHDNTSRRTAATTTRTGVTKTTKSSTKPCIHVASHGIFISRRAKAMTTTTIGDNEQRVLDDEASYASARHISHCAQAHMLRVKHRCNNQPGNVKLRRAQATSSNIDDLVRERTRLSSFVRKRTSYSIKHIRNNQPFQRQA
jgi:hypothetical protein